ncbi:MAG: hypothetical protein JNK27_00985 [Chitinophagaceae bacterium]|nr:hypothetical protein [Chitinophagaceae bacterium]
MKKQNILITLVLLALISNGQVKINDDQAKLPANYIRLEYRGGDVDKPIPEVYFSTDSIYYLGLFTYGVTYKIDECEFLKIKKAIEESRSLTLIDTTDVGYYQFYIVINSKTKLYKADNISEVSIIFKEIEEKITGKDKRSVTYFFRNILNRIK